MRASEYLDSLEAKFAALFNSYYGGHIEVSLKYSPEWMFSQVKEAAGIHFSSFKDEETENPNNENAELMNVADNRVLSDYRPPPQLLKAWGKKKGE